MLATETEQIHLFARVLVARVFVIEGVRWRCVVGVEVYGGRGGGVWWKG